MRNHLFIMSLLFSMLAQAGGQPLSIPIHDLSAFTLQKDTTLSRDTGVIASDLQAVSRNGVYTLKFSVQNYFTVYPGYYEAKISLGQNHELCSTDGWATQNFTQVTLVCPSPGYIVFDQWPDDSPFDPNAHLVVSFSNNSVAYWPLMFDNVSLSFTPESQ